MLVFGGVTLVPNMFQFLGFAEVSPNWTQSYPTAAIWWIMDINNNLALEKQMRRDETKGG